jgi:hypothetical protein
VFEHQLTLRFLRAFTLPCASFVPAPTTGAQVPNGESQTRDEERSLADAIDQFLAGQLD